MGGSGGSSIHFNRQPGGSVSFELNEIQGHRETLLPPLDHLFPRSVAHEGSTKKVRCWLKVALRWPSRDAGAGYGSRLDIFRQDSREKTQGGAGRSPWGPGQGRSTEGLSLHGSGGCAGVAYTPVPPLDCLAVNQSAPRRSPPTRRQGRHGQPELAWEMGPGACSGRPGLNGPRHPWTVWGTSKPISEGAAAVKIHT